METTNGDGDVLNGVDTNDVELSRPAIIKEDLRQMDTRKRVNEILTSQTFKQELEQIVNDTLNQEKSAESMAVLQELTQMMLPLHRTPVGLGGTSSRSNSIIPISDIRGVDSLSYNKEEKLARCTLATTARLIDFWDWNERSSSNTLLSLRCNKEHDHFLVSPLSVLLNQLTATSFLKIDMLGQVLDTGSTTLSYSQKMWSTYAAIHSARPDVQVILPLQSVNTLAVSSLKQGLLLLSKHACVIGEFSTFDASTIYNLDDHQKSQLIRSLGPSNKVLMIRNAGFLICGENVEEATWLGNHVLVACEAQIRMLPAGMENLHLITDEECQSLLRLSVDQGKKGVKEFEAHVRMLDHAGYRTDYPYHSISRQETRNRINDDVEYPPSAVATAGMFDDGEAMSPMRKHQEYQKRQKRTDWLGSPNTYKREEHEETGTDKPKKYGKWVETHEAGSVGPPLKISDNPNIYAPQGVNPNELRNKHKEIRKEYYDDKISAGPQSRVLEGATWKEAGLTKEIKTGSGDQVITIGAVSKGIIQRDHQHNVGVYKQTITPNPFANMTEEDLENYKRELEQKERGEIVNDSTDGRLISTNERLEKVRKGDTTVVVTSSKEIRGKDIADRPISASKPERYQIKEQTKVTYRTTSNEESRDKVTPLKSEVIMTPIDDIGDFRRSRSLRSEKPINTSENIIVTSERYNSFGSHSNIAKRLERLSLRRKSRNEEGAGAASPTKSASSDQSREGSPVKDLSKKKKKFRMPSFAKNKKDKDKK